MKWLGRLRTEQGGYTIVETLIVLAASSLLLLAIMSLISGQQGRTQFSQAARDADSRIQDTVNDFASGFYSRPVGFNCTAASSVGGAVTFTSGGSTEQGKNVGCAYVGRILQVSGNSYQVHTLVGRQFSGAILSEPPTNLLEARAILPTEISETATFQGRITLARARYFDAGNTPHNAGPFGIISNFGRTSDGQLVSDKQTPRLIVFTRTNYTDAADLATDVNNGITEGTDYVLDRPMELCFLSDTSNQYAIVRIGSSDGSTTTDTRIGEGTACP